MDKKCSRDKSRDAELERLGWVRRFVADELRLSEAVELYKSLGYEVRLEPAVSMKRAKNAKNACYTKIVTNTKRFTRDPKRRDEKEATIP